MSIRLYDLAENFTQVLDMIDNGSDGLEDTLEALDMALDDKLESCVKVWRNLIGERDKCKAEAYRLTERANSFDKQAERLKRYVEDSMKRTGKRNVNSTLFTIRLQANNPSVDVQDESKIPPEYIRQSVATSVNKQLIMEQLNAGVEIPGVALKQTESLRVR